MYLNFCSVCAICCSTKTKTVCIFSSLYVLTYKSYSNLVCRVTHLFAHVYLLSKCFWQFSKPLQIQYSAFIYIFYVL